MKMQCFTFRTESLLVKQRFTKTHTIRGATAGEEHYGADENVDQRYPPSKQEHVEYVTQCEDRPCKTQKTRVCLKNVCWQQMQKKILLPSMGFTVLRSE